MFGLARIWHFTDESASNPVEGITRFKERKRKRWVTPLELPALAKAIDGEPNIYVRAAVWLYLLTGMRKEELTTAKWKDVDFERGVLRLPETKSGEEQNAVLNAPALAILRSIPRLDGNSYILPGSKPRGHLTNIGRPWRRIRARASVDLWQHSQNSQVSGLVERLSLDLGHVPSAEEVEALAKREDVELPTGLLDARLHDLRRTVGSWMSQASTDLNTIREALRHSSILTTLTYARLGADPARQAMEEHGRRVMEIAGRQRMVETPRQKE
jgi:integrase